MTMKYTHQPVYNADCSDVENFIKEIFGKRLDIVNDWGEEAHEYIVLDVVDTGITREDEARIVLWQRLNVDESYGDYLLETILSQLSEMGHIPAGKWYIRIPSE